MRKIGIITFHASENFGSALQAFALENILIDNGYNAEIINCILESDMKQYNVFRTHIYLKRPMALLGDFLYLFRNIKRKKSFLIFQNKYLKISYQLLRAGKDDLSFLNERYESIETRCAMNSLFDLIEKNVSDPKTVDAIRAAGRDYRSHLFDDAFKQGFCFAVKTIKFMLKI